MHQRERVGLVLNLLPVSSVTVRPGSRAGSAGSSWEGAAALQVKGLRRESLRLSSAALGAGLL